ncbi:hypothetical protein ACA910_015769 [Epithemia clementina (nom. ined.)]
MILYAVFLLATLFLGLCLAQNFDFDPNAFKDGKFQAKFCQPYRCPKGQEPVPKWPLGMTSTGCSGLGGQATMLTPNQDNASKAEPCCDLRHACYQTCGMIKTHCDEQFVKCSEDACATLTDEEERKECEKSMSIHLLMVKLDQSCQRYDQEQYQHCECVEKKNVANKRERVLRSFYKKFNPENVDKVDGLIKKVDTASKMAGLMVKLVAKYPSAIKKVKDPQQEYMERLMRDVNEKSKDGEGGSTSGDTNDDSASEPESDAEDLGVDEL